MGSFATLIGASLFPVSIVCILLGGGELITGNMMAVAIAWYDKKISFQQLLRNWAIVSVMNLVGAFFVAYFFGHFVGLTEGDFLPKTLATAGAKINDPFWVAFVSGIGCNWFVGIAVWLCYAVKISQGKSLVFGSRLWHLLLSDFSTLSPTCLLSQLRFSLVTIHGRISFGTSSQFT